MNSTWIRALPSEVAFWRKWFRTKGAEWPEDYQERLRPRALQRHLANLLPDGYKKARVLDVGAGPLTLLGTLLIGREIEVVPVDPLASEYDKLLAEFSVTPIVKTIEGTGERLLDTLDENSFEFAHAQNSLDHGYDPMAAIEQMIRVVKPGCVVYLAHQPLEGQTEGYEGLHQWNFERKNDRLLVWNSASMHDVTEAVRNIASIEVLSADSAHITTVFRKYGIPEEWDDEMYLERNPDVRKAVSTGDLRSGYQHWRNFGMAESRLPALKQHSEEPR